MTKRALVLIGSPRGLEKSSSASLSRSITEPFDETEWTIDRIHLHQAVQSEEATADLNAQVDAAELILFAAPLYVDSLPAPAIRAFEQIATHRTGRTDAQKVPRFAVLVNCGFVEPQHNRTAVGICRRFSEVAGFEWSGDLMLGAAGARTGRVLRALREAGQALSKGFPILPEVRKRVRRPVIPRLAYILVGNLMWRRMAKRLGVSKSELLAQPYL